MIASSDNRLDKKSLSTPGEGVKPEPCPQGVSGVLLAVSGGADSVALARIFAALPPGPALAIGHVDHGLRPESGQDADFVAGLARRLGLPFFMRKVRVPARARGLEDAARLARRAALLEMAQEAGADLIALAHTADDQAETVLARALTGSGPSGLAGMRPLAPPFWRPLLAARRAELRECLARLGQTWREDASNQDLSRQRNRLRHRVLPLVEREVNPRAVEALARLAGILAEEEEQWESWSRERAAELAVRQGDSFLLSAPALKLAPALLRRLLRHLAGVLTGSGQHLAKSHLAQVLELAAGAPGRLATLPAGLMAAREAQGLRLYRGDPPVDFSATLQGPCWLWLPHLEQWLVVEEAPAPGQPQSRPGEAWLPAERVSWPLTVRAPRPGEVFRPLGAPGGKKLNRVLRDRGAPPWWRSRVVLLEDRNGPWWAGPWLTAERARLRAAESCSIRLALIDTNQAPAYTRFFSEKAF